MDKFVHRDELLLYRSQLHVQVLLPSHSFFGVVVAGASFPEASGTCWSLTVALFASKVSFVLDRNHSILLQDTDNVP
jgi:hypothetical protein